MAVTREEVVWCYRALLQRDPESDAALASHLGNKSFRQLVEGFVRSPEFTAKRRLASSPVVKKDRFYPLGLKGMEVDTEATAEQLSRAIAKVKTAWTHLGAVKPHFSVITDNQFLPENIGDSIDRFWASGEAEAMDVQRILERQKFFALSSKTCVEYGCGVGRVTMGLARRFRKTHGYDISRGHLAHARQRAHQIALTNVFFHQCDDDVLADLERCDFFYSRIVFQHNPPPIIAELIRKALRAVNPGGIAIFQIPTYGFGYRFALKEWLAADQALDMQMHCLPQEKVFSLIAETNCVPLEVREDNATGAADKYISNTFVVRKNAS
ncbi:MAG: class I SAM-dependent methyltransferase [Rhodobacteraceae bacterium]|nr:class I SAM-dependent methyltransferase [Paracoccaceae bacterium]